MNLVTNPVDDEEEIGNIWDDLENDPDFVAAGLATELAEEVAKLMDEQGMSRSALAQQMGVHRAYVTKVLNAPPNLTLRSIAALSLALKVKPKILLMKEGAMVYHVPPFNATTLTALWGENPWTLAAVTAAATNLLVQSAPPPPQGPKPDAMKLISFWNAASGAT